METFHSLAVIVPVKPSLKVDVEERFEALSICRDPQVKNRWSTLCEMTRNWQEIPLSPNDMCLEIEQLLDALGEELQTVLGSQASSVARYLSRVWTVRTHYSCVANDVRSISDSVFTVYPYEILHGSLPLHMFDTALLKSMSNLACNFFNAGAVGEMEKVTSWVCTNFRSHLCMPSQAQTSEPRSLAARSDSVVSKSPAVSRSYNIKPTLDHQYASLLFARAGGTGSRHQTCATPSSTVVEVKQLLVSNKVNVFELKSSD